MHIELSHQLDTAVEPSPNVMQVAAMFGLGIDQQRRLQIISPLSLQLQAHQLIFITGPSGGGKSTLLRLIENAVTKQANSKVRLIRFDQLPPLPDRPLVDCLGDEQDLGLDEVMKLLSRAGLNDAFVMLRRANELSDGQRYRLRLAQSLAQVRPEDELTIVLADEFASTLDRVTAKVIAHNVRKFANEFRVCFVVATTHDDLLEPLNPDVLIQKQLGEGLELARRGDRGNRGDVS